MQVFRGWLKSFGSLELNAGRNGAWEQVEYSGPDNFFQFIVDRQLLPRVAPNGDIWWQKVWPPSIGGHRVWRVKWRLASREEVVAMHQERVLAVTRRLEAGL